jgi:ABC-type lipoprotein export system ATPase subunit
MRQRPHPDERRHPLLNTRLKSDAALRSRIQGAPKREFVLALRLLLCHNRATTVKRLEMISSPEACAIQLCDVSCSRTSADGLSREALHGASAAFMPGTFTVLTGPEAGGRNLCLRLLSLLDAPDVGDVLVDGQSTRELDDAARAELRARRLGLVFSAPFLLPSFTAIENIAMPLFKLAHVETDDARQRAEAALRFVGLSGCEESPASELSGFEQQCVALARALAAQPAVLLVESIETRVTAETPQTFVALLRKAAEQFHIAVIGSAGRDFEPNTAGRVLRLEQGILETGSALLREPLN